MTATPEAMNETVHGGTSHLPAGAERTVRDTAEARPSGVETFAVTLRTPNATVSEGIRTSERYGDVHPPITDRGDLVVRYGIR